MSDRALFVVEPDFLSLHVGVRRVIMYYYEKLCAQGYKISFAYPDKGRLFLGKIFSNEFTQNQEEVVPFWSSSRPLSTIELKQENHKPDFYMVWTDELADPDLYDVNVVTNPWLCDRGIPPMPRVIGIVYDLVPNLLAAGVLRFPNYVDAGHFAYQHDVGFRYFLHNAQRVICISEATKKDFMEMYQSAKDIPSVVVDIPFSPLEFNFKNKDYEKTVLLVNALDWRKNLRGIEKALSMLAEKRSFKLRIVGKERFEIEQVFSCLKSLADLGVNIEWYRGVNDAILYEQYSRSSVLLFPSLYEGLGLPILEAQEFGVPVITSNISSCPEVNRNDDLCFSADDVVGMSNAISAVFDKKPSILQGRELKELQSVFLKKYQNPEKVFTLI